MTAVDIKEIMAAVCRVVPGPAALHEPVFAGNEWVYVKECLDTGWVSTAGSFVDRFESELAQITGASHVIATNTGTSALHAALLIAGIGGRRDSHASSMSSNNICQASSGVSVGSPSLMST